MTIGIDFDTKTTKVAFTVKSSKNDDYEFFEIKNILTISNSNILVGEEGFGKFLTDKNSTIYDLNQIIKLNGLTINKTHLSIEKCLSIIFESLLKKIKTYTQNEEIDFICVSIPYARYYYWNNLIKKAFSLLEIQKIRIISQPTAFFCSGDIIIDKLKEEISQKKLQDEYFYTQDKKKYDKLPWYKKLISKKPTPISWFYRNKCILVVISQDNLNISLNEFSGDALEVISTQYSGNISRREIEQFLLNYLISEISKKLKNFVLEEQKTLSYVLEKIDAFLKLSPSGNIFELNLPYVLCRDKIYRPLEIKINLNTLHSALTPLFDNLVTTIKELVSKMQNNIKYVIVFGDLFIFQKIKDDLSKIFNNAIISLGSEKSLALGALNYAELMESLIKKELPINKTSNFLSLEVIPFPVFIKLGKDEFIEIIRKDSTIPISKEFSLQLNPQSESKWIPIYLFTKEENVFQNLDTWYIEKPNTNNIKIIVDVGIDLTISLNAYSEHGRRLFVQKENILN
jgi:molecular chaperone DnaK (HSP70)